MSLLLRLRRLAIHTAFAAWRRAWSSWAVTRLSREASARPRFRARWVARRRLIAASRVSARTRGLAADCLTAALYRDACLAALTAARIALRCLMAEADACSVPFG